MPLSADLDWREDLHADSYQQVEWLVLCTKSMRLAQRSHLRHQKPASIMVRTTVGSDGSKVSLDHCQGQQWSFCGNVRRMCYLGLRKPLVTTSPLKTEHRHTSNLTRSCKEYFSSFRERMIWLPTQVQKPVLWTLLTWPILERNVSVHSNSNVSELKNALLSSWIKLNEVGVGCSGNSVTIWLQVMIKG